MTDDAVPIVLCADDFGLAPGVSRAIASLAQARRISAISCMTRSPSWPRDAARLHDVPDVIELGLHLELTGTPPRLGPLALRAFGRRLDRRAVADDIERQIDAFECGTGRSPDFVDGHLHVHQLPVVRDAVIAVRRRRLAPQTWIRNTAAAPSRLARMPTARTRAAVLALLGQRARQVWVDGGAPTNRGFAGVRHFAEARSYRSLLGGFLCAPAPGLLVMCHPGEPDAELAFRDPVVAPRQDEFDHLRSAAFEEDLARAGIRLAPLSEALARRTSCDRDGSRDSPADDRP